MSQAGEPADSAIDAHHHQTTTRESAASEAETSYLLVANPYQVANNDQANVRLLEYRGSGRDEPYFRIISFPSGKPTERVRDFMKSQGVQWNKPTGSKSWNVVIHYPTRSQDRVHAERVFRKVVDMILDEKGLTREPELERF